MNPCPNHKQHTKRPDSYIDWHEWAAKKMKTHKQIKCKGCGLYKVWVPKKRTNK